MVKVIFVKNPFSPSRDRVVKLSEATNKPLSFYIDEFVNQLPKNEAYIEIDGRKVPAEYLDTRNEIVKPNSFIVVMPKIAKGGGKSLLGLVAVIALSVVSFGVGGLASGAGMWGAGMGAWTFGGYLAAAAVMFLGGSLISKFMAPKIDTGKYQTEDPTYSWNGVQTMDAQGNGIAITYGKVKSGGQSLQKFTTNDGDDQYFNWLVSAGEGPLTISDIKLNDNPIENFESVFYDTREGGNEQDIIDGFGDTFVNKSVGYELANDEWRVDYVDSNAAQGIVVELECSQGLYHANDNGSLGTAWIDPQIECALDGTDDWIVIAASGPNVKYNTLGIYTNATKINPGRYKVSVFPKIGENDTKKWTVLIYTDILKDRYSNSFAEDDVDGDLQVGPFMVPKANAISKGRYYQTTLDVYVDSRISGAKSGVVRRQFRIDNLPAGKYKVRVAVTARSAAVDSTRDGVKIWWTQCNAIIYDDFSYPNTALIGIKAKATSQLSGSTPRLTFIKERANVLVWSPNANDYVERPANNPAWAAYDFIHGAKRLYNINTKSYEFVYDGVPKELMLYDQFEAWAANCDTMNLKINIEIVSVSDFWTIVNQDIAPVGRGLVVQFGTKFGCIYDHASQPVQLFNMGNIIQGSFELSYLGTEDRADVVEVTYFDAANDYEKSVITIYADDYDDIDIPNQPTQLTFNGITSYEQAYREGKYQLFCNKLLQETITFKTDVEAISCQVGDQILVSHDVPEWSYSGRIDKVNADGSVVVGLDIEEIAIPEGETWGIMVRNSTDNTLTTYTVAEVSGKYGEVKIKATSSIKANEGDLFSLGRINSIVKPFVVKSLQKSGDLEYTISALEYVEGVYSEDYTIPEPNYSLALKTLTPATNLKVSENLYTNDSGELLKTVYLTWQGSGLANIYVSIDDGETFYLAGQSERNSASIEISPTVDYIVKVCTTNGSKETTPVIYNGQNSSAAFDLSPATNFRLEGQEWLWDAVDNGYIDYYELRLDQNPGKDEGLLDRTFVKRSTVMPKIASGTAYLYIKSKTGAYSEPASYAFSIALPPKPSKPLLTASLDGVNILMDELPAGCTHYMVTVLTHNGIFPRQEYFEITTSHFSYFLYSGHIGVSYAFVNDLGEGEWSDYEQATVEQLHSDKIPDGEISGTKIEDNSVTAAQIAANTIVANNLAADCVTSEKILAKAITSEKIAANAVNAINIAANAVTAEKIKTGAITADKMNVATLSAICAVIGELKTAESGPRMVLRDNLIEIFDDSRLRIKMGVWEE